MTISAITTDQIIATWRNPSSVPADVQGAVPPSPAGFIDWREIPGSTLAAQLEACPNTVWCERSSI